MKKEQTVVKTKIVMDMKMQDKLAYNPNGGKKAEPFSRQKQYRKVWTLHYDLIQVFK